MLMERITAADESERMPPESDPLSADRIRKISAWIEAGTESPANEKPQQDPKSHWAYQKAVRDSDGPTNIDEFIEAALQVGGLKMAEPAERLTLVRRLFLDLHGLPPSPAQIQDFVANQNPKADEELVEELLASPRYGERWAQHWLDVVRYADTHGYEVNTPRENAWPYRDYVIRAFNEDLPYNQFAYQQLVGDAVGEDAATGFLVAAAVLLPGQIGRDEASKRQARQDSLDEIIVGTSGTFLGLTVGCARCHNHKFDPITQRDYYAMQAFFAGVSYGDRAINDAQQAEGRGLAAEVNKEINVIRAQLAKHEPKAFARRTIMIDDEDDALVTLLKVKQGHGTNPAGKQRGYKDDIGDVQRLPNLSRSRYTWWMHKPGEDVFTYNPRAAGKFRLWISWGVHGSGVHTRDARYILDRDGDLESKEDQTEVARADQYYFANVTEGNTEQKPLWSGLFNAGVHQWTKDSRLLLRGGDTGTGITADAIVLQAEAPVIETSQDGKLPRMREPVNSLRNVERFTPIQAKYVRFTSFATINNNEHQPCIDELEIFTVDEPKNIALAKYGTKATSSGNYSNDGSHQLKHINNGLHGNSQSWISNEYGKGWVQLELAEPATIDRIVWARDREGKFRDRLAVDYRIEVAVEEGKWTTVASSGDRLAMGTPFEQSRLFATNSDDSNRDEIGPLVEKLTKLEQRQLILQTPKQVYGGVFRAADKTFLLSRGDPEQPGEQIAAAVPVVFGSEPIAADSTEQERREALANWIIGPENPLTARVIVNRIWQYHFGRGIVETPSDFGMNGALPSHPELLDWLALELVENDWSIKHIHRLILKSKTYRQSNQVDAKSLAADADCRLLWRFPARRLEAEAIRDSMIQVTGKLNLTMGGPGFDFFKTRGGLSGFPPVDEMGPNQMRRMIYAHKIRMEPVPVFGAFDCPDAGLPTPRRSQSTTAIQALNLFNSPFVIDQANVFAGRIEAQAKTTGERVRLAFQLAVGRNPSEVERQLCEPIAEKHGLATVCRVLFNSSEFLYIP
ncbi:MAG: hypothetical protein ACI9HK_002017 [Pirellulaceae bacterium]